MTYASLPFLAGSFLAGCLMATAVYYAAIKHKHIERDARTERSQMWLEVPPSDAKHIAEVTRVDDGYEDRTISTGPQRAPGEPPRISEASFKRSRKNPSL